ncbi:hypothetical protein N7475_002436 [Penicillium sp. IBT 31633x]|nr:hypothetical protein N7475_002436 [Penicillium sp. IBT 31633x]
MVMASRSHCVPRRFPIKSQNDKMRFLILCQVVWPNGHGVSLTLCTEKVPGSIPGTTIFLSLYERHMWSIAQYQLARVEICDELLRLLTVSSIAERIVH